MSRRGQSRAHSMAESLINVATGFGIAFLASWLLLPVLFGFEVGAPDAFWITVLFSVLSFVRMYLLRRLFNWLYCQRGKF